MCNGPAPLIALCTVVSMSACGPVRTGNGLPARTTSCSTVLAGDTMVYDTTQVEERPAIRSGPAPRYPSDLRRRGVQGRVVLAVIINADGTADVGSLVVTQRVAAGLDSESVRFVRRTSFWPGCLRGRAVRVRVAIPIDYKVYAP